MKKETKYICFKCGKSLTYEQLIKKMNYKIGKLETYNHYCTCKNDKFLIISIVERL